MDQPITPKSKAFKREACCQYCGVPFSPMAMNDPCKEAKDSRHYFQIGL